MKELLGQIGGAWEFFLRLGLSFLYGGLIGFERESHGRAAGLRTIILVSLGSTATILAFQHLDVRPYFGEVRMDPARAAAGVITGIGFLGAGTIIKGADFVRGLTTAATIWVVAAIGINLGLGQYQIATAAAILTMVVLYLLKKMGVRADFYRRLEIEGQGGRKFYEAMRTAIESMGLIIKNYGIEFRKEDGATALSFVVKYRAELMGAEAIESLSLLENVKKVSWQS